MESKIFLRGNILLCKVWTHGLRFARRWVDENNALAIFTDPESAHRALKLPCKYKLRPFAKVQSPIPLPALCSTVPITQNLNALSSDS